jgi:AcrR family transcriptional regulator
LKKTNSTQSGKGRRRRRRPEAAESEILNAAENFLRESPLRDMTIDDIMSRTGLSRPSFYEYFRDRNHLVTRLTERLGARNSIIGESWLRSEQPVEDLRRVMQEYAELAASEGHLMRALVDAADTNREVETTYRRMLQEAIDHVAQRIRDDAARGLIDLQGLDAQDLAGALVHMNQSYFIEKLGRRPQADPKAVGEVLATIWIRVLYGRPR